MVTSFNAKWSQRSMQRGGRWFSDPIYYCILQRRYTRAIIVDLWRYCAKMSYVIGTPSRTREMYANERLISATGCNGSRLRSRRNSPNSPAPVLVAEADSSHPAFGTFDQIQECASIVSQPCSKCSDSFIGRYHMLCSTGS